MMSNPPSSRKSEWMTALLSLAVGAAMLALVLHAHRFANQGTSAPRAVHIEAGASAGPTAASVSSPVLGMHSLSASSYASTVMHHGNGSFNTLLGNAAGTQSTTSSAATTPCRIYPIALHVSSLTGVNPGSIIYDIYNGSGSGNFGWLSWNGETGENSLVTSLTPPGNVESYIDPNGSGDRKLTAGDWVSGRPGLTDSADIRNALNNLKTDNSTLMLVPLWDTAEGSGTTAKYHIVDFVIVNLISFQLSEQDRITAKYVGRGCPPPPPPPTSIDNQLRIHSRYDPLNTTDPANSIHLSTSSDIAWPHGEVLDWLPKFDIKVPLSTDSNYTYRLRIIAWSYVRTENTDGSWSALATAADTLGRSGCRAGPTPSGDTSGLNGCIYAYPTSSTVQLSDLLSIFWSVKKPLALEPHVYAYQLPKLEPAYIVAEVKYVIDVMHSYDPNGQPAVAGSPQFHTQRYKVNLVAPRSIR